MISTSKIKKITAIRKKRSEKGSRADPLGSKPHSKGEFFSRSIIVFLANKEARIITTDLIIRVREMESNKIIIAFSRVNSSPFGWKPKILFILKKLTSSPINRNIEEKSNNINKMSISGGSFKSKVMSSRKMTLVKSV